MEAPSQPQRCKFWLPRKNRFCSNPPITDSRFCGNHNPKSEEQRIPCPLDPSHSVLKENIEAHIKRCPFLKQAETLRLQPFYKKGINGGEENAGTVHFSETDTTTADMKRKTVYQMTTTKFLELLKKVKQIHASLCSNLPLSYEIPEACSIWMRREVDGKLPFQEKHVLQQASILGNLEALEALPNSAKEVLNTPLNEQLDRNESSMDDNEIPAVVEFGAGRGYLTQMLADCYGIQKVFLVERRSYKLKADRSLRQKESLVLERLRIDIEDLDINAVKSLRGIPYLAIGKHLCGPATDLTLRCCLREHGTVDKAVPASDNHLRGLAIATCCHHLCQWKHYINNSYFSELGITKDDFHAITWFTSWAVDADHSTDLFDAVNQRSCVDSIETKDCCEDVDGVEGIVRNMQAVERAVLGFMCKDIIDMGRLMWIKEYSLVSHLVKYVPSTVSPENRLLVAKFCSHV